MVVASSVMWILLARGIEADSGFIVRGGKGIICKVKWGLCVPTLFAEKREKDGAPGTRQKIGNLQAAYYLWFAFYNFCRVQRALRVTLSMGAGLSSHPLSIADLLGC